MRDEQAGGRYKWVALSNTTLSITMATIDASIVIIAMPAIFRGIGLDPLAPANVTYLLWMIMGYLLVTAVLVVTLGRLGDMYGRVRIYNLGFVVFTLASIALSLDPYTGSQGAIWLIVLAAGAGGRRGHADGQRGRHPHRRVPGPPARHGAGHQPDRRDRRAVRRPAARRAAGRVVVARGVLGERPDRRDRHHLVLPEPAGDRLHPAGADRLGRATSPSRSARACCWPPSRTASSPTAGTVPAGPARGWSAGWRPGPSLLVAFCVIETKIAEPMFQLGLFKIRAFAAGNAASLLGSIARGGLQFMLVIWLAGIWLPLHGYDFAVTPLWAGIYMLPLTTGFLLAGPVSGYLSDRFGPRPFATAGLLVAACAFCGLMLLPVVFPYWAFALLIFGNGIGSGLFASPNTSAIMSSVPARHRGSASGMRATFQNSGMALSIGIFFSLMIVGLAATLPRTLSSGLHAQGVPLAIADHLSHLPPVSTVFAALLGYNPVQHLLAPSGVLATLPAHNVAVLTGNQFFPHLISGPFHHGLIIVFTAAAAMSLVGAGVSLLRGSQFYYDAPDGAGSPGPAGPPARAAVADSATQAPNGSAPRTPANGGSPPPGEPVRPGALPPATQRTP